MFQCGIIMMFCCMMTLVYGIQRTTVSKVTPESIPVYVQFEITHHQSNSEYKTPMILLPHHLLPSFGVHTTSKILIPPYVSLFQNISTSFREDHIDQIVLRLEMGMNHRIEVTVYGDDSFTEIDQILERLEIVILYSSEHIQHNQLIQALLSVPFYTPLVRDSRMNFDVISHRSIEIDFEWTPRVDFNRSTAAQLTILASLLLILITSYWILLKPNSTTSG